MMVYYTKGEMKKTGWNNELVAQEYIDLYIFDPLHTRLRAAASASATPASVPAPSSLPPHSLIPPRLSDCLIVSSRGRVRK